jgi:hypothetical protein
MTLFITINSDNEITSQGQINSVMDSTPTTILGIRPETYDTHYDPVTNSTYESEESYAARQLNKRNVYLAASDYTQIPDATFPGTLVEWQTYRQALRDITSHSNWPYLNPEDWPTEPS